MYVLGTHPDSTTDLLGLSLASFAFGTDSQGSLSDMDLGSIGFSPYHRYYFAADYNADGMFTAGLDAYDGFLVVPTPGALALASVGTLLCSRRRRSASAPG